MLPQSKKAQCSLYFCQYIFDVENPQASSGFSKSELSNTRTMNKDFLIAPVLGNQQLN